MGLNELGRVWIGFSKEAKDHSLTKCHEKDSDKNKEKQTLEVQGLRSLTLKKYEDNPSYFIRVIHSMM